MKLDYHLPDPTPPRWRRSRLLCAIVRHTLCASVAIGSLLLALCIPTFLGYATMSVGGHKFTDPWQQLLTIALLTCWVSSGILGMIYLRRG